MNANDHFGDYTSTGGYHKFGATMMITDSVLALCVEFNCFWFLDIVLSYQPKMGTEEFQVWKLCKNADDSALVTCTDGDDGKLVSQAIDWTDFKATEATIWVEGDVALLPSEH